MPTSKEHWNAVYEGTPTDRLGWYEEVPRPSLELIGEANLSQSARLLDAGAGSTTLIDHLLEEGYENIIAVDVSEIALKRLAERVGPEQAAKVEWIVGDVTDPQMLAGVRPVDLWHDRAVLHFLTEEKDRQRYVRALRSVLKPGGHVVIADPTMTFESREVATLRETRSRSWETSRFAAQRSLLSWRPNTWERAPILRAARASPSRPRRPSIGKSSA